MIISTNPTVILTIGHSTRPLDVFIRILKANDVTRLIDVRTIPRSRFNPQFNTDTIKGTLAEAGIGYVHMADLGGLRHPRTDSLNSGWRNASFRGYADYMQTEKFAAALALLITIAAQETAALMCAEAVPWRCHRSLIADALTVRGISVEHIMSETTSKPHVITPWAKVEGTHILYPAQPAEAEKSLLENNKCKGPTGSTSR